MHAIVDLESNERINHAQDITIGKQVWFGLEAMHSFLKDQLYMMVA